MNEEDGNLWRGRLSEEIDKDMAEFISSLSADKNIAEIDIDVMEAHNIMLSRQGIISKDDLTKILGAFEEARKDLKSGKLDLDDPDNLKHIDVHPLMEKYVIDSCGVCVGGKTHFGKSRNDQVMTDVRIRLRDEVNNISELLLNFAESLLRISEDHTETVMPGYTHMQHAQITTYSHYLLSYVDILSRDLERYDDLYKRLNLCPLGACALAGSSIDIDREYTAELLGFDGVLENTIDAVSNRDFILEFGSVAAITMTTLSRMARDLITWSTYEFGFIEFDDRFSDISSAMPQKKNPCSAEMVKGKTGSVIGSLMRLFATVESSPTGYNLEFQELNAALWESIPAVKSTINIMNAVFETLTINEGRMREVSIVNNITALDLAEVIAKKEDSGITFREAHFIVGNIVKDLISQSKTLTDITPDYVSGMCKKIAGKDVSFSKEDLSGVVDPLISVSRRKNPGHPAPAEVKRMIEARKAKISMMGGDLKKRQEKVEASRKTLRGYL